MHPMSLLLIYCGAVIAASLLGGWLPSLVPLGHRRMQMMISTVAGLMLGVALLFGKETVIVGDDEPEVARASKVGASIIDFVENAMADCEPGAAQRRHRRRG